LLRRCHVDHLTFRRINATRLEQNSLVALVVGGGKGERMGTELPKQFLLLRGKPVLVHTLEKFLALPPAYSLTTVVVLPEAFVEMGKQIIQEQANNLAGRSVFVIAGGASRGESVYKGLEKIRKEMSLENFSQALVAIHDAVRPLVQTKTIVASYESALRHGSGICAVACKSSLRMLTQTGSQAVDRSLYREVQTPQTFQLPLVYDCYQKNSSSLANFTDDASLVESQGHPIQLIDGDYENIKITTPEDLLLAEAILEKRGFAI